MCFTRAAPRVLLRRRRDKTTLIIYYLVISGIHHVWMLQFIWIVVVICSVIWHSGRRRDALHLLMEAGALAQSI